MKKTLQNGNVATLMVSIEVRIQIGDPALTIAALNVMEPALNMTVQCVFICCIVVVRSVRHGL